MQTWEYGGKFYLTEGLINLWRSEKFSPKNHRHQDPPLMNSEVERWLKEHQDVVYAASPIVGPPMWIFLTDETRTEFISRFLLSETDPRRTGKLS